MNWFYLIILFVISGVLAHFTLYINGNYEENAMKDNDFNFVALFGLAALYFMVFLFVIYVLGR